MMEFNLLTIGLAILKIYFGTDIPSWKVFYILFIYGSICIRGLGFQQFFPDVVVRFI